MPEIPRPSGGGRDPSAAPDAFVLELPSDLAVVETTIAQLVERCRAHHFAESRLSLNFRVGVAEALANAILYGNGRDPHKRVRVVMTIDDAAVSIEVSDEGNGFDPDGVADPTLPDNIQRAGGRGVFLIRRLMDEVEYLGPGNAVRLVLYRQPRSGRSVG